MIHVVEMRDKRDRRRGKQGEMGSERERRWVVSVKKKMREKEDRRW